MAKYEINVTEQDHEDFLRKYQEILQKRTEEKVTLADAATRIFEQGVSRVKATTKYAKAHPTEKKPRAPKAPKPAKAPKAKGPLARKQASKAKAPKVRKAAPPVVKAEGKPAETPATSGAVLD